MHIKITPNLLFEYQCTSGKFIRLLNRIEKNRFGSENRIESYRNFFCPNWNALVIARPRSDFRIQKKRRFQYTAMHVSVFVSCRDMAHVHKQWITDTVRTACEAAV